MANFPTSLPSATPANHGEVVGELVAIATALIGMPGRNQVVNGNFRTNQRAYASAGALASGAYGFDRWKSTTASSSMTFTAAPQGQTVTINSGGSFAQIVERAFVEADTYTLTWAGTATGRVYNVGGSVPSYAASPVTVAVDGLADLTVEFTAAGGTRTLGAVQLEVDGPTPFERVHPGLELAMCQRYFRRIAANQAIGDQNPIVTTGYVTSSTTARFPVMLASAMRTPPSLVATVGGFGLYDGVGAGVVSGITLLSATVDIVSLHVTASGLTAGRAADFYNNAAAPAYLDLSAEL